MLPPRTFVNAICSALAFVILPECFASFLSLATPDQMPKADKATIKITERRKSLGFMIQVRHILGLFIRFPRLKTHGARNDSISSETTVKCLTLPEFRTNAVK